MAANSEPPASAPVAGPGVSAEESSPRKAAHVGSDLTRADRSRRLLFGGLAIGIVVVDQIVKAWIVSNYEVNVPVPIVGDALRIWLSHNTGAIFGMFRDQAPIFALFSLLVIGIILWYERAAGGNIVVTLALGLLLGGALGNLTDRLRLNYVVDFMDMGIGTWRWYTFNVADAAISASVVLLFALAVLPGLAGAVRDA